MAAAVRQRRRHRRTRDIAPLAEVAQVPPPRDVQVPFSIVEDCMRDIDKIVWQLDVGDLDKPFDINDCEVRNLARVGPAARPKQSPSRKLNPTTFIIPSRTPQAIGIETTQESVLSVSKASTSDKGKAPLEPIVLVDLDSGKKHQGQKTMDANSGWIDGVGHVTYEPIRDYGKSEDDTNRFWLRGIMSDIDNDNRGCSEVVVRPNRLRGQRLELALIGV